MFNLGDEVIVTLYGEITEIRKVGSKVRYCVSGNDTQQAYVNDSIMERIQDGTAKDVITEGN